MNGRFACQESCGTFDITSSAALLRIALVIRVQPMGFAAFHLVIAAIWTAFADAKPGVATRVGFPPQPAVARRRRGEV